MKITITRQRYQRSIEKLSNIISDWLTVGICLLLGHIVFILIQFIWQAEVLEPLELMAYDHGLRWQTPRPPDKRIILIGQTEADIQRWGHPVPDGILAEALERLVQGRPRVIGVDIFRDHPIPPGSERLDQVLRRYPMITWIEKFGTSTPHDPYIPPPASLIGTDRVGACDFIVDNGILRRGLLELYDGQRRFRTFSLVVTLHYLKQDGISLEPRNKYWHLGKTTISRLKNDEGAYVNIDTGGYQFLLDYKGRLSGTQIYALSDVLEGRLSGEKLIDKIILIGVTAPSAEDYLQAPMQQFLMDIQEAKAPVQDAAGRPAGVALHGLQINQLLRYALEGSSPLQGLSNSNETTWLWFWCLTGIGLALCRLHFAWLLVLMGSALTILIGIWHIAFLRQIWLPLITPMLGLTITTALCTAYLLVYEYTEKKRIRNLFSSYTPKAVVDTLWQERRRLIKGNRLIPQQLRATVLFSDIKDFTTIAERLEPADVMSWLNDYMETMAKIIMAHGGIIKQYVGDEIMALFGAPIPRQTTAEIILDASKAVKCALEMGESLKQFNAKWLNDEWIDKGLLAISIRVGIHTGPMVSGSLGGNDRLEYAVVGDIVNIASRLQSLEKDKHFNPENYYRILVSENTHACLDARILAEKIGEYELKGKNQKIVVYRIDRY